MITYSKGDERFVYREVSGPLVLLLFFFLMTICSEAASTILRHLGFSILERGGSWCQGAIQIQGSVPCFTIAENTA